MLFAQSKHPGFLQTFGAALKNLSHPQGKTAVGREKSRMDGSLNKGTSIRLQ